GGDAFIIRARRAVIAQQRRFLAERHADHRLKGPQVRQIVGSEPGGAPLVEVEVLAAPDITLGTLLARQREEIGVSIAHDDGTSQPTQTDNDLMRLRAERSDVTQANNVLDTFRCDLRQHRVERWQIPMNIRENGNCWHDAPLLLSATVTLAPRFLNWQPADRVSTSATSFCRCLPPVGHSC